MNTVSDNDLRKLFIKEQAFDALVKQLSNKDNGLYFALPSELKHEINSACAKLTDLNKENNT